MQGVNGARVPVEHLATEEQQGTKGLILSGCDVLLHGQVAHIVENDLALDPADVGSLPLAGSAQAVRMD